MSRVAKAPVEIPHPVEVTVGEREIVVKGPKGTLTQHLNRQVQVKVEKGEKTIVTFQPYKPAPAAWAQAGTARALVNNIVQGVTEGFKVSLELIGIGYRAQASKHQVTLALGFSHPVEYKLPEGVHAEMQGAVLTLQGIDKQLVGQVATEIRALRPPEPYKGKGVRYLGEVVIKKEAKKK